MNIGVLAFAPGPEPGVGRLGAMRLMEEAMAHLSEEGNLGRVDQGPLNYRWKHGAKGWRWARQLHAVRDASGPRLCGLVNGSVVGGVLPSAQFCNTQLCRSSCRHISLQPLCSQCCCMLLICGMDCGNRAGLQIVAVLQDDSEENH